MQGNNLSGPPAPRTWIHRLDPRTKLLLIAISFIMVLLPRSPYIVGLATLLVLGHITLARSWRALAPMMVAGLTLLSTTPAEELFWGLAKCRLPYPGAFAFAPARRWPPSCWAAASRSTCSRPTGCPA
jgi:energy-coupling factor transporter transmembrane protein EcfT